MSRSFLRSPYWLFVLLIILLAGLQYRLWLGEGGVYQSNNLKEQIKQQENENKKLIERNRMLEAEVIELKKGTETIEENARRELGMVKDGETLYIVPNEK